MTVTIHTGDVLSGLAKIESGTVQTCVTSPPYWGLRDYGVDGQIGLESSPDEYVARMVAVFSEVRRCLRDDGTLWLNLGDSYASSGRSQRKESPGVGAKQEMDAPGRNLEWESGGGHNFSWYIPTDGGRIKPKDLCMIPWRVALALQADGWWLRSVIVWAKKSPMPESVTDRPTSSWEPIFLLAKSSSYYYDAEAVKEPCGEFHAGGKNNGLDSPKVPDPRKKQDALGKQTYTGFNARWSDNPVATRNQRNVWHLGPEPFTGWIETSRLVPVEVGAVGDDIQRTPSADCPVHGCRDSRQGDEREACSQIHNHGIGSRRVTTQSCEQESSLQNHGSRCPVCSSDSQCLSCSMIATHHSTQTHKTGHDSATTPTCMLSAQTGIGTCDTGEQHAICDSADRTTESSTEAGCVQGASGSCLSGQTISGSEGKCTCKYHRLVTKKIDHFATFPTEIPRRCILAGSKPGDLVLDPFLGSGTTLAVAAQLGRNGVGCELNPEYVKLAQDRIGRATRPNTYQSDKAVDAPLFGVHQ